MSYRIVELRKKKHLSQADLAQALGVTRQSISLYEQGKREPRIDMWKKMADFFNVDIGYLQGVSDIIRADEEQKELLNSRRLISLDDSEMKKYLELSRTSRREHQNEKLDNQIINFVYDFYGRVNEKQINDTNKFIDQWSTLSIDDRSILYDVISSFEDRYLFKYLKNTKTEDYDMESLKKIAELKRELVRFILRMDEKK